MDDMRDGQGAPRVMGASALEERPALTEPEPPDEVSEELMWRSMHLPGMDRDEGNE